MEVAAQAQSVATVNSVELRPGNNRNSLADPSEVSSASNKWDDIPSTSQPSASASSLKQNEKSDTPEHHASNHLPGMISPSENNATEIASPQNDPFISLRPSLPPLIEPPSQPSSLMMLPVNTAKTPSSPRRHSRIPSTGSRITVMEVSQSLNNAATSQSPLESCAAPISSAHEPVSPVENTSNYRATLSQIQAEKRKSSYEKYSAIILPPLKEEATPAHTPVGTLTRTNVTQRRPSIGEVDRQGDLNKERSNDDAGSPAAKTEDIVYLGK